MSKTIARNAIDAFKRIGLEALVTFDANGLFSEVTIVTDKGRVVVSVHESGEAVYLDVARIVEKAKPAGVSAVKAHGRAISYAVGHTDFSQIEQRIAAHPTIAGEDLHEPVLSSAPPEDRAARKAVLFTIHAADGAAALRDIKGAGAIPAADVASVPTLTPFLVSSLAKFNHAGVNIFLGGAVGWDKHTLAIEMIVKALVDLADMKVCDDLAPTTVIVPRDQGAAVLSRLLVAGFALVARHGKDIVHVRYDGWTFEVIATYHAVCQQSHNIGLVWQDASPWTWSGLRARLAARFAGPGGTFYGHHIITGSGSSEYERCLRECVDSGLSYLCIEPPLWRTEPTTRTAGAFRVALRTRLHAPYIVEEGKASCSTRDADTQYMHVPDRYLPYFKADLESALRDIAGRVD